MSVQYYVTDLLYMLYVGKFNVILTLNLAILVFHDNLFVENKCFICYITFHSSFVNFVP